MTGTATLDAFTLDELAPFTKEGAYAPGGPEDHRLFYVGRDDVHGILVYLFQRVQRSVYLNMFGYDDDALNALVLSLAEDPTVTTQITLDKSQAGGVHEKQILMSDAAANPTDFRASFAIGQSETHQISHTKGGVLDGLVGFEGSTNWSASGEGTIVVGKPVVAQNNTLMVFTDPTTCAAFGAELIHEHAVVVAQGGSLTPQAVSLLAPPPMGVEQA